MILFPNCKINLGLNIVARRSDGYHDIETVMVPVPWCDILEIVPAPDGELRLVTTGNQVDCPMEKNLVMKAYRAVAREYALPPVHIYLHKIIPDGAGLGGGSSDASFTIIGLDKLFNLGMSRERMAELAATIGADCPFFIYNRPRLATGIGTVFSDVELDLDGLWIVIAKPPVSVPTREAYAGVTPKPAEHDLSESLKQPVSQWQGRVKNDFEPGIFSLHGDVEAIKQRMLECGALYSAMSGSGSAVFGLFVDEHSAAEAHGSFKKICSFMGKI
ncbi:MAG: 4-(cytidine 5'-diphospho)-2-C-methyl-D-erythritol kinase [Muribaculaceae bacterium]|nr:4-(cytidine 5'-diphospho)-2-C-methyl-D-erythritol kinase [Muribaculaceae bacterium]